jgi:methionine-rich copper-binding protein CopC
MKRALIALGVGAIALAGALAIVATASAHARPKEQTPNVGEVLQTAPTQVAITFTEDIQKVNGTYDIAVTDASGASVTSGPAVLDEQDRSKLSVPLQPNLPAGRYVVRWHNVSDDDGDPLEGAFSFYVQVQPSAANLQNDAQLAQIGAEEETPGAETPAAGTPGAAATTAPASSPTAAVATAVAPSTNTDDGGSNTGRNIGIAVGIIAVVAIVGLGGWVLVARRR